MDYSGNYDFTAPEDMHLSAGIVHHLLSANNAPLIQSAVR